MAESMDLMYLGASFVTRNHSAECAFMLLLI